MHGNDNRESISQVKRRLHRFAKSRTTLDLRSEEETRRSRALRYARKHKTEGRRAVFS